MFRMCGIVSNPVRCLIIISVLLLCMAQCSAKAIIASTPNFSECERDQCKAKFYKYLDDMRMTNTKENIEKVQGDFNLPVTGVIDDRTCAFIFNRWSRRFITWRIVKRDQTQANKFVHKFDEKKNTLIESFKEWTKTTKLMFVYVNSEDADIQITFGDNNCMAHEDGIVLNFTTHDEDKIKSLAFVYPPGDENSGGDIHFIGDKEWTNSDSSEVADVDSHDINLSTASFFAIAYVLGFNDYNENGALLPLDYYQKKEDAENYIQKLYRKPSGDGRIEKIN